MLTNRDWELSEYQALSHVFKEHLHYYIRHYEFLSMSSVRREFRILLHRLILHVQLLKLPLIQDLGCWLHIKIDTRDLDYIRDKHRVHYLNIKNSSAKDIITDVSPYIKIDTLYLRLTRGPIKNHRLRYLYIDDVDGVKINCPKLKHLYINNSYVNSIDAPNLKLLSFCSTSMDWCPSLVEIRAKFPKLDYLSYDLYEKDCKCYEEDESNYDETDKHWKQLVRDFEQKEVIDWH